ncbi:MAG: glycosyltransferase family 4 protein [Bacteroidetes bacterium]|nr:glycosyltransferase family 4 protein [Bacteroidota bacterium]
MKVLIVCRKNPGISPFITEQADAVKDKGIDLQYFFIQGKGLKAYINSYSHLKKQIIVFKPDIIHAHYGLSGLFANLQRSVPVVTTFHGGDINYWKSRPFSLIATILSRYNIFVSSKLARKAHARKNYTVQPCGISLDIFYPVDKKQAREKLKLSPDKTYILFAASFNNWIKNIALARAAIEKTDHEIHLIELKGYTRKEVNFLLNACDLVFMTSLMEGSPQIIKEAMACNCPIVSTNVGSVEEIIDHTEGCFITGFDHEDVSEKLKLAIDFGKRTNGRDKVAYLDNSLIADKIISIYQSVL